MIRAEENEIGDHVIPHKAQIKPDWRKILEDESKMKNDQVQSLHATLSH